MRLVDDDEEILGEIVEETRRPLADRAAGEVARIVLHARARADFDQHLEVERGARVQPLRLEQLPGGTQLAQPLRQLRADRRHGAVDRRALQHEVLGGIDGASIELRDRVAGERLKPGDPLDLVAPEFDPHRLLVVGRVDLDSIAADAKRSRLERRIVPLIVDADQLAEYRVAPALLAYLDGYHQRAICGGIAQTVDRRHSGHDDHVVPLHQRRRRPQSQRLEILVDRRVLFDVYVGRRNVRLGLVVVVVRHEILDRVGRKELLELAVELGGKRLVVGEDQGRPLPRRDGVGERHGLAATGDAQERLIAVTALEPRRQLGDGAWLVPGRGEGGLNLELWHGNKIVWWFGECSGRNKRNGYKQEVRSARSVAFRA